MRAALAIHDDQCVAGYAELRNGVAEQLVRQQVAVLRRGIVGVVPRDVGASFKVRRVDGDRTGDAAAAGR